MGSSGVQRCWEVTRLRGEPAFLHHAVVDGGVGVGSGGIGADKGVECLGAVGLVVVSLQHRLVSARRQGERVAVGQRDFGTLDVRVGQFLEGRGGSLGQAR